MSSDLDSETSASKNPPKPGLYRHYKGRDYQVLGTARDTETEEEMVVYRYLYGDFGLSVRPLRVFTESVVVEGKPEPRFKPVPSKAPAATQSDNRFMQRALELARYAGGQGEVPVAAVVVLNDEIVGEGWNRPVTAKDPTAHAEINALCDAALNLGNYRLPETKLYVTIEPCTMCAGAIMHARIAELIFGAPEPKAGVVQSQARVFEQSYWNHRIAWRGGVLAEQAQQLMQEFFKNRRKSAKQ